jgi:hypothetical protein
MENPFETDRQRALVRALLRSDTPDAEHRAAPPTRLDIYRNNQRAGLVRSLRVRFPVCARLVGEAFFLALTDAFSETEKPKTPVMLAYGETFPAFLDAHHARHAIPYLADVARLELAWSEAYHAADDEALDPAALRAATRHNPGALRLALHPSVRVVRSSFPVATIWEAHQHPDAPIAVAAWAAEDVLVSRPAAEVLVHRLPPGGAAFAQALLHGDTLGAAAAMALTEASDFDLAGAIATLLRAGAIGDVLSPRSDTVCHPTLSSASQ